MDTIIHLVARVHVMHDTATATDPLTEFRRTNTAATINLAQQAGVRRIISLLQHEMSLKRLFGDVVDVLE